MLPLKSRGPSFLDNMHAARQPHVFLPFSLFFLYVAFSEYVLYHNRFLFVWKVRRTFLYHNRMVFFFVVTTGWISRIDQLIM